MYSVTDRKSFDNIEYWAKSLEENCNLGVSSVLVGNKKDLTETREVSYDEGKAMADKNGMLFFETSAKTGEGIENIFLAITKQIIARNPNIVVSTSRQKLTDNTQEKPPSCC